MNNLQILMMNSMRYDYGYLYNWYAVDDSRKLAPAGFFIPRVDEWMQLSNYLGGDSVAGGKLKEIGTKHWQSPNTGATNQFSFKALPAGYRIYSNGVFDYIGTNNFIWSFTESDSNNSYYKRLDYNNDDLSGGNSFKKLGLSVRCNRIVSFYGALYNWYATTDSRNIAPVGCHVPNIAEWDVLIDYLGGGDQAGYHVREAGNWNWYESNSTNKSGFSAIPHITRYESGGWDGGASYPFYGRYSSEFWSTTYIHTNIASTKYLYYGSGIFYEGDGYLKSGLPIRCICDTTDNTITDIDGNIYDVVQIGTQRWLCQDLKVTRYRNGDVIPNVTDNTAWSNLTTGGMCYYNNAGAPPVANQPTSVTDYDGNVYPVVQIGRQLWTTKNLKVTHYNDGTLIPNVTSDGTWAGLTTGALCAYDNNMKYV